MNDCNGICDVFREGNLSKVLELVTRTFNMNVRYVAGEPTYHKDLATDRCIEVCYIETPYTACVSNGRQNCVNLLLAAGIDVNFPDSLGLTPLMHAVIYDQPAIQTLLLYNRADVKSVDHFYETALVRQLFVVNLVLPYSFYNKEQNQMYSCGAIKPPCIEWWRSSTSP